MRAVLFSALSLAATPALAHGVHPQLLDGHSHEAAFAALFALVVIAGATWFVARRKS